MINKMDLNDVTFLIPIRIDSKERERNLNLVLEFIKMHFETNIMVLEADKKEQVHHSCINKKIFIEDHDPVFHRTKYLNQMTRKTSAPFLAIWDTDIILNPSQIEDSVNILRHKSADMVFPYDGRFYNVPPLLVDLYKSTNKLTALSDNKSKMNTVYGHFSVCGAFFVKKEAYVRAGMENENFYGWGPEDIERVKRWDILGYNIKKVNGPLFHLFHPRFKNSWFISKKLELKNRTELIRICSMNFLELSSYVATMNKPTIR